MPHTTFLLNRFRNIYTLKSCLCDNLFYIDDMLIIRRNIRSYYDAKAHSECVKEDNKIYVHKSKNTFYMNKS